MSKVLETFKGLPGWAKGTIAVGSLAIATLVGITIYKNRQAKKKAEEDMAKLLVTKNDADALIKAGMRPTYNETEYNSMADTLFTAMDGYSTDTNKIWGIMSKMKNDLDIHNLILAYGTRELSTGRLNPVPNVKQGLASAFADELGYSFGSDVDKIAGYEICTDLSTFKRYKEIDIVNCILNANGVKFKF